MKLTVLSKISALLTNIRKWKIKFYGNYRYTNFVYFVPTIFFKDWSAMRSVRDESGNFVPQARLTEYMLILAFLTAYATVSLYKEEAV